MPTANHQTPQRKRKRARTVISCTECHRRKQKCDRQHPCGNCTLRSASHLCHYESKASAAANNAHSSPASSRSSSSPSSKGESPDSPGELSLAQGKDSTGGFGYSRGSGHTALNVLEKLDLEGCNWTKPNLELVEISECVELHAYTKHIRHIPPRPYTQLLVRVFFAECNWIYGTLHEETFMTHLEEWFEVWATKDCPRSSFKQRVLSQFPALLLQVLAIALQMLPKEHHKFISQLSLGKDNFYTLSSTYSNAACELASLVSASSPTLPRVQQWFLRGSWLKSEGRAVEAWHALGQAIREAQEMGLHREQPPKPPTNQENNISCIWNRELEKRVWVNLYVWDRFMAMILGRPTMINDRHCNVSPPLDCEIPADLTKTLPVPRGPLDPPNSFTQRLLDYHLANLVDEIDEMEAKINKMDKLSSGLDLSPIDMMQSKILSFTEFFPPALAIHNRDTSYDAHHPFLAVQSELLKASAFCLIVGLHRPLAFSRDRSKQELVKASLVILESQTRVFQMTKEHYHTIYTLCFFTFDPAVLIAAVIITSPSSLDPPILAACMAALRSSHSRLEALGHRIKLAEKGSAVLKLLISKSESAISCHPHHHSRSPQPASISLSPPLSPSPPPPPPMPQSIDFDWTAYANSGPVAHHPRDLMAVDVDLDGFFDMPLHNGYIFEEQHLHQHQHHHQQQQQQEATAASLGDGFWQGLLGVVA